jgi:hypothetical protein
MSGYAGKGREVMTFPGFYAEASLYKTSVHYRLNRTSVEGNGVAVQQASLHPFYRCGVCYIDENGWCSRDCENCILLFPTVICHDWWHEWCPCATIDGCPIGQACTGIYTRG